MDNDEYFTATAKITPCKQRLRWNIGQQSTELKEMVRTVTFFVNLRLLLHCYVTVSECLLSNSFMWINLC